MNTARYLASCVDFPVIPKAVFVTEPAEIPAHIETPEPQQDIPSDKRPLDGYNSESNAYVVDNYPYGGLRTQIRFWLEKSNSKGFRFVSQTKNPKTGRWNNPKPSTYSRFGGQMYLDEKNHVVWDSVSEYTPADKVIAFLKNFPNTDKSMIKPFAVLSIHQYERIVAMNEKGLSGFAINGQSIPVDQHDAERNKKTLDAWREVVALCK